MGPDERPPNERKTLWVVAGLLFLAVAGGGVCLALYIVLPPESVSPWLPSVGLGLIALPWAFWFLTCAYRCVRFSGVPAQSPPRPAAAFSARNSVRSGSQMSAAPSTRKPPDVSTKSSASSEGSSERKVRFGDTVVLGSAAAAAAAAKAKPVEVEPEASPARQGSPESSVASNDSEVPLTAEISR